MLRGEQDASPGIDGEAAHRSGDATGQSQFAGRIEKEEHALADAIALAARPQANPLRDGQVLAGHCAADRSFHMERDGDGLDRLAAVAG